MRHCVWYLATQIDLAWTLLSVCFSVVKVFSPFWLVFLSGVGSQWKVLSNQMEGKPTVSSSEQSSLVFIWSLRDTWLLTQKTYNTHIWPHCLDKEPSLPGSLCLPLQHVLEDFHSKVMCIIYLFLNSKWSWLINTYQFDHVTSLNIIVPKANGKFMEVKLQLWLIFHLLLSTCKFWKPINPPPPLLFSGKYNILQHEKRSVKKFNEDAKRNARHKISCCLYDRWEQQISRVYMYIDGNIQVLTSPDRRSP